MPLRVAEVNGWLKAVDCCDDCGFVKLFGVDPVEGSDIEATSVWRCGHPKIRQTPHEGMSLQRGFIPVWCPLPIYQMLRGPRTTATEAMILEENKMRGKHPGNIMWGAPAIFVVEDVEIDGLGMNVTIRPELPQGPDYTCLRKDDWLRAGGINYLVAEPPTSSKIRLTHGPKLSKDDRLIGNGPAWEEKRKQ